MFERTVLEATEDFAGAFRTLLAPRRVAGTIASESKSGGTNLFGHNAHPRIIGTATTACFFLAMGPPAPAPAPYLNVKFGLV